MAENPTRTEDFFGGLKESFNQILGNRVNVVFLILGVLFLLVILSSHQFVKTIFFLSLLLILNLVLSFLFIPASKFYIGFELILLSTVLAGLAYGPKVGLIMGALSALVNYIANSRFSIYCLVEIPLYMLIGLSVFLFQGMDIVTLGLVAAIVYNVLLNIVIIFFLPGNLFASFIWSSTNIVVTYFIFKFIAPIFLHLMVG